MTRAERRSNRTKPRLREHHFRGRCTGAGGEVGSGGSGDDEGLTDFAPACCKLNKWTHQCNTMIIPESLF